MSAADLVPAPEEANFASKLARKRTSVSPGKTWSFLVEVVFNDEHRVFRMKRGTRVKISKSRTLTRPRNQSSDVVPNGVLPLRRRARIELQLDPLSYIFAYVCLSMTSNVGELKL